MRPLRILGLCCLYHRVCLLCDSVPSGGAHLVSVRLPPIVICRTGWSHSHDPKHGFGTYSFLTNQQTYVYETNILSKVFSLFLRGGQKIIILLIIFTDRWLCIWHKVYQHMVCLIVMKEYSFTWSIFQGQTICSFCCCWVTDWSFRERDIDFAVPLICCFL